MSPAARRSSIVNPRSLQRGFSLIELLVVVTIIGILAAAAMINVRNAIRKAQETALKDNLFSMRKAIDNFYADKQRYPNDLEELVPNYIRKIPPDPMLKPPTADWELVMDDPTNEESADPDPEAMTQPGVVDVKSKAEGTTLDGVAYNEL
jgi:general secretion pathway protein G